MAISLSLENLAVETFATSDESPVRTSMVTEATGLGCGCGGTLVDCPSDAPRCTEACPVPSNATDFEFCCG